MNGLLPILALIAGIGLGVVSGWILLRARSQYVAEAARGESREELTKLAAQLDASRAQVSQDQAIKARLKEDLENARQQLLSESRNRAAAESQAAQLPKFEGKIRTVPLISWLLARIHCVPWS